MDPSQGWVALCEWDEIPAHPNGKHVVIQGQALAVFRIQGEHHAVRAIDDTCPHAGASLSGGHLHEGCVVCPWHGWPFDVDTGRCPDNPEVGIRVYPACVHQGRVWARVDPG